MIWEKMTLRRFVESILGLLTLLIPIMIDAQPAQAQASPPPIAAPLVREGTFAVKLQTGLALGMTDDEVEAENRLADAGISPRNGWIADYPVTPDIIGELQQAVSDAADSGKVSFSRDEALQRFNSTLSESSLSITPYSPQGSNEAAPSGSENYPNPSVVNNYYYNEGPPVMTYYIPPPDFYYLYAWVPFPFWCSGFWFPGFFVLHDFHRTIIVNRRPVFVSNHFRDVRVNRVFRIDPDGTIQGQDLRRHRRLSDAGTSPDGNTAKRAKNLQQPPSPECTRRGNGSSAFSAEPIDDPASAARDDGHSARPPQRGGPAAFPGRCCCRSAFPGRRIAKPASPRRRRDPRSVSRRRRPGGGERR